MSGMSRHTGRRLDGAEHLAQSIHDILTTPKGSVVMLRDYGSDLPDILDQPMNGETLVDIVQASAEAIAAWEPRIDLARVVIADATPGAFVIDLLDEEGNRLPIPLGAVAA